MGRADLKAVASLAGVSISTVSRVLNGSKTTVAISEATKKKVVDAARRLGYVPVCAARALRRGYTRTIAVLCDAPDQLVRAIGRNMFDAEMMRGLVMEAVRQHLHLLFLTGLSDEGGTYNDQVAELGMADGLLVLNRNMKRGDICADVVLKLSKPVVYLLEYPDDCDGYICAPDDVQGGRLATGKLLELGHRRIGFLTERSYYPGVFGRRRSGWETALRSAGIEPERSWIIELGTASREVIEKAGLTAIVSPNDRMAQELKNRLRGEGMAIPDDISIVTFAYDAVSDGRVPPTACVSTPLAPLVARGVEMLSEIVCGNRPAERKFMPEFAYVAGRSVTAPRGG
ncbi:MAG: LacI family transcriptional regulator [Planctomycetota bacterium]|nr:LacI family transcriptional regulator [Planctomycetota bacterium]